MRVAIVAGPQVPIPPPKYGGTEQVIFHLIRGLQELKHEIILLAPADSKADCELIPIVDSAIYFPSTKEGLPAFNKHLEHINKYTGKKLRNLLPEIDIIHSHGFDLQAFRNFPNLTTLHGPFGFTDLDYYLQRKDLYFVSISNNQCEAFPDLNYLSTIYNGENPADFPFIKKPDDYLCFLGRFDEDKNPHLAIMLAIQLGIKIKMAGKLDYLGNSYFQKIIKPYFKHPLVEYLGEIGFAEKVALISKAKCNLHPTSFREPFGLAVIEAAYCGTPTLAIRRGSMPELIENGKTGVLVEDFVEGFHQINKCFELDRQYIAKRAREKFNYQNMAKQYSQAYKQVVNSFKNKS